MKTLSLAPALAISTIVLFSLVGSNKAHAVKGEIADPFSDTYRCTYYSHGEVFEVLDFNNPTDCPCKQQQSSQQENKK